MNALLPLRLQGATVVRGGRTILGPLDLELGRTGLTAVMGPNGAGKTTLLRAIHGLVRLSAGGLAWSLPLREARTRQAFVFQAPIILRRSVLDNIAYPLRLRGARRSEARAMAQSWAERVGLAHVARSSATVLSGGEKQKLALARAMIRAPELLILDEPTANLDGRSMREIETLLGEAAASGTRVLIATHNLGQARRLADEVVLLVAGTIRERAFASEFFCGPVTPEGRAFLKGDILE